MSLRQQLIQSNSSDKEWHDKESDMKDYANTPSPSFIVISGPTNCGKSSLCKNSIVHKNKPYTHICVFLHYVKIPLNIVIVLTVK